MKNFLRGRIRNLKKTVYILGSIEILSGVLVLCIISLIKNTLPALGRVAYQAAAAGSYSATDYAAAFPLATVLSVLLICAGLIQIVYFFFKRGK